MGHKVGTPFLFLSLPLIEIVPRNFQSRKIIFPFPILVNYVHEVKRLLFVNSQNETQLLSCLDLLKTIPFSIELARETDIAFAVNSLGKQSPFPVVNSTARELTKRWKAIYSSLQSTLPPHPPLSSSSVALGAAVTDSSSNSLPFSSINPSDHNINHDSPQLKTWRSLYSYCEDENTNIFHTASTRVSEIAANLKTGKRSTCSSASIQQETDEKKKRRLQARINELKMPTPKRKAVTLTTGVAPRVKSIPIIPLHQQKIQKK
jgi:hypothetical protein